MRVEGRAAVEEHLAVSEDAGGVIGLFVPLVVTGALFGRLVSEAQVVATPEQQRPWVAVSSVTRQLR